MLSLLLWFNNYSFCKNDSNIVLINSSTQEVNLKGKIYKWADYKNKSTINEVVKEEKFQISNENVPSFGYAKANGWLKLQLQYSGNSKKEMLIILPIPLTYHIEFFLLDEQNKLLRTTTTGCKFPFNGRAYDSRYFVFPIHLEANKLYNFYCKAYNNYGVLNMPLLLMSKPSYQKFNNLETIALFSFIMLLVVIIIISFALYINFKDQIYLFYIGYLFSIICSRLALFGYAFQYLHPLEPEIASVSKILFWIFAVIFFNLFTKKLLKNKVYQFKKSLKILKLQHYFYACVIIYMCIQFIFPSIENIHFNTYLIFFVHFNFLVSIIIVLRMAMINFKTNHGPSKYFAIAFVPLLIIMIISILSNYQIVSKSFITNYPIELGLTFEVILLSTALISRHKIIINRSTELEFQINEYKNHLNELQNNTISSSPTSKTSEKYVNSKHSNEDLNQILEKLKQEVAEKQLFLDKELSISKLSEATSINQHLISQVLNQVENKNFYDFINAYRICKAKEMLMDKNFQNYSIEGIGTECGFNTKATFYTTFKKFSNCTPAEFRKKELDNNGDKIIKSV